MAYFPLMTDLSTGKHYIPSSFRIGDACVVQELLRKCRSPNTPSEIKEVTHHLAQLPQFDGKLVMLSFCSDHDGLAIADPQDPAANPSTWALPSALFLSAHRQELAEACQLIKRPHAISLPSVDWAGFWQDVVDQKIRVDRRDDWSAHLDEEGFVLYSLSHEGYLTSKKGDMWVKGQWTGTLAQAAVFRTKQEALVFAEKFPWELAIGTVRTQASSFEMVAGQKSSPRAREAVEHYHQLAAAAQRRYLEDNLGPATQSERPLPKM